MTNRDQVVLPSPLKIAYRVLEAIILGLLIWVGTSVQSIREDISAIKVTNTYMQETRVKVEALTQDVQENSQDLREMRVRVKELEKRLDK